MQPDEQRRVAHQQPQPRVVSGATMPIVRGGTLPHDMDAEGTVLAALLERCEEVFDRVADFLKAEHFYAERHKLIYTAIRDLREQGKAVGLTEVFSLLRERGQLEQVGGAPYLAQLIESPYALHIEQHAYTILSYWKRREMITTTTRVMLEAYSDLQGVEVQEWIERSQHDIEKIGQLGSTTKFEQIGQVAERYVNMLEEAKKRGVRITGTPTGFLDIDKQTSGLNDTDFTIVAGRPGLGKTAFLLSIARSISRQGEGVALFSLEMPKEQIAMRMLAMETGIPAGKIRKNLLTVPEYNQLHGACEELKQLPFWIDDDPGTTIFRARSAARRIQKDVDAKRIEPVCKRLGAVCVDYLQLMHGDRKKGDTREQEVASVARGLKSMAKEMKLPVVANSQLNRSVEQGHKKDKRPMLSDLRESGSLEQDADNVWFLFRPGYYEKDTPASETELIVAKQRNGPTGTVELYFDVNVMRFLNHDQSDPDYLHPTDQNALDNFSDDGIPSDV